MATYLVERYLPDTATTTSATLPDLPPDITVLEVIVMEADDVCFWLVAGPSAEAVSRAFEAAGIPVDRVAPASASGGPRR